ncbi:SCO family protein [Geothrix sp. PMB-07]|uniref:SCO family protein n=1 Tax=Geothrix sp. PMB-07 TaxID=3068640 RepID=UPI002741C832|nr:SCO family protein [Geothrix sp. PMB-07]WLT32289.1 SCO family protein [Geothrix sp. PMB-07]
MHRATLNLAALVLSVWAVMPSTLSAQAPAPLVRTLEAYTVPDLLLVNQDGAKVKLKPLLESGEPVILDFIFGTCTTICPVLSAGYANLQAKLPPNSPKIHLISISIDPENDTPKVMRDYLKRYRAKPGWDFLTGRREDIDKAMIAFNAYIPNKMAHYPLTLIRDPKTGKWVRLFGMMSSSEFMAECRKVGIL